jgi:hypothetical protein
VGERKWPEYPWQIPLPAWAPGAKLSEAERRRDDCRHFFEFELHLIEEGVQSRLVHDPEHDVFRFPDGRFALSREHADWACLKRIGYFRYWGM